MPHTGSADSGRFAILPEAIHAILANFYRERPITLYNREKRFRNQQIQKLYEDEVSTHQLAKQFGISEQRVHQILRG